MMLYYAPFPRLAAHLRQSGAMWRQGEDYEEISGREAIKMGVPRC